MINLPYVIINGVDSRSINGLIVQSYPPIVTPQMRTEVIEIDGRDGDVSYDLGYAAYDRELSIALYGNFDVAAVSKFFVSEGEIVFGNEPEHKYKFKMKSAITYQKVLQARASTVVFHVQPFKYSSSERPLTFNAVSNAITARVRNTGNVAAYPKVSLTGNGTVGVTLGSTPVLILTLSNDVPTIIIDCEEYEAYEPDGTLRNRSITGDYRGLSLIPGYNDISVSSTGTLTSMTIEKYSRWI